MPDNPTKVFADHRELLFSIVYNMLGSVADTEDVLQEAWLSWASRDQSRIENPRAYLVRIAVNQALAQQSALRRRREAYVGPWLPEPLVASAGDVADGSEEVLRAESVSMAMLVVLETLSPLERAVFILHEVFAYAHTEIADMIDRSPSAVRQLAHRARGHVQARRPRHHVDPRVQRQVTERFVAAAFGGDLDALMEMLAPQVTLWSDGGGRSNVASPRPVKGRATRSPGSSSPAPPNRPRASTSSTGTSTATRPRWSFARNAPFAVMVVDLTPDGEQVRDIYVVSNPDKLSRIPEGPERSG
ncbi:sigma-70 family RNA polymerase sigma factor [Nonomuraea dietziae]|uniref:sigma-70 family RNA polymerase sigma factor n=1 Tax=Nonomuraea dietziae TaxID=65515 RepID=UPI0031DA9758